MSKWVKRIGLVTGVLCVAALGGAIFVSGSVKGFVDGFIPATDTGDPETTSAELVAALEAKPTLPEPNIAAPVIAEPNTTTPATEIAATGKPIAGEVATPAPAVKKPIELDDIFPVAVSAEIGGKKADMRLTGHAVRRAMRIRFYKIGSYCCETVQPADVDSLAAADVPKQLLLVMERDISSAILERSFRETFEKNDPDKKFVVEIQKMLDYMTSTALKKGEHVVITHLPKGGISVRGRNQEPIVVNNPAFATVVWNVYMGPKGVSEELRTGLGSRLAKAN